MNTIFSVPTGRRNITLMALLTSALTASTLQAAPVVFDHRENLNLLNSPEAVMVGFFTPDPVPLFVAPEDGNFLRGAAYDSSPSTVGWFSSFSRSSDNIGIDFDLGTIRNIKTLRMAGQRVANSGTFQTSADGVNWSAPISHSVVTPPGATSERTYTLNSAVETRYLRFVAQSYSTVLSDLNSLGLSNLRLYGDVGTVTADGSLDLVSSSGWTAGGVTITNSGPGFLTPSAALLDMADDNAQYQVGVREGLIGRQLIYGMGNGSGVAANFATPVDDITRVGINIANGLYQPGFDPDMHFRFVGSNDGFATSTVLLDQVGGLALGPNFFDLASSFDGLTGVRFEIVSAATTDNRVADIYVFQGAAVPEPTSIGLLAAGSCMLLRRRRLMA